MFTQIYGVPSIGTAAQDLGLWQQAGLTVHLTEGQTVVQALESNSVDIAWSAPMPFIAADAQGANIKMIGPTSNVFDQYIIARKGLNVTTIDGLASHKGLKVGVTSIGASGNYGMVKLADKLGWTKSDYKVITLGNLAGLQAALARGTIDLFTWSASAAFALRDSGAAVLLGNLGSVVGPIPFGMLAASDDAIKNKAASLKAFCAGYYTAQTQLKADPAKATQILIAKGGLDPKNGAAIVNSGLSFQSDTDAVPDQAWQAMADATMATVPAVKNLTGDDVKKMFVSCSSL
jgi:ABC-type nitrate/sulfonate/bicarbonate transport system substrate-binding protein